MRRASRLRLTVSGLLLSGLLGGGVAACGSVDAQAPRSARAATASSTTPKRATRRALRIGLERLDSSEARSLRHRRVGLIANRASVTADGTSSVASLRAHGVHVRRLFTPEHGLDAKAGAGVAQVNGVDQRSGLPYVSLYGDHVKPTAHDLAGLDALVFDLQDVGVRFYTYVSTEILAMQAAAQAGIPFVVLDRPNPLGGTLVAGPVRQGPETFVATAPGPLVNGLTAGEMARYVNAHSQKPARLVVVPMVGWTRDMTWAQTGRRWIPPSPGLRSAEAALLYPGVALFEGTNISEGRGTATPFRVICAPWLDVDGLIRAAGGPGVRLSHTTVVPAATSAVPDPKYKGRPCRGIRLDAIGTDGNGFRAGLALLLAARRAPQFQWLHGGTQADAVLGTPRLRRAVDRGSSLQAILSSEQPAIRSWLSGRKPYLLYR